VNCHNVTTAVAQFLTTCYRLLFPLSLSWGIGATDQHSRVVVPGATIGYLSFLGIASAVFLFWRGYVAWLAVRSAKRVLTAEAKERLRVHMMKEKHESEAKIIARKLEDFVKENFIPHHHPPEWFLIAARCFGGVLPFLLDTPSWHMKTHLWHRLRRIILNFFFIGFLSAYLWLVDWFDYCTNPEEELRALDDVDTCDAIWWIKIVIGSIAAALLLASFLLYMGTVVAYHRYLSKESHEYYVRLLKEHEENRRL
jgi:hypothetical protein